VIDAVNPDSASIDRTARSSVTVPTNVLTTSTMSTATDSIGLPMTNPAAATNSNSTTALRNCATTMLHTVVGSRRLSALRPKRARRRCTSPLDRPRSGSTSSRSRTSPTCWLCGSPTSAS
jgi:hypothetical protein